MQELAAAQATFEHNVLDASDAWSLHITDPDNLRGLPDMTVGGLRKMRRRNRLRAGCCRSTIPTYDAVLTHADSRDLREAMYGPG